MNSVDKTCGPKSISSVVRDGGIPVVLLVILGQVVLGITHFEEVVEFFTSEWIVSILFDVHSLTLWLLDVPEDVVWNSIKDLGLSCSSQRVLVSVFEILNIVVFLV